MTTTQLLPSLNIDLHDFAGDYLAEYDMDAIHADYVALLNERVPDGVTITIDGGIYVDVDVDLDEDWRDVLEVTEGDLNPIFERHQIRLPLVGLGSVERAERLATLPALGFPLDHYGATVALTDAALVVLAGLDEDEDGYFDGTDIWIGGTDYEVRR